MDIEKINWSKLNAVDVKHHLRELFSGNAKAELLAAQELEDKFLMLNVGSEEEEFVMQMVSSKVPFYTVPFLIHAIDNNIQPFAMFSIIILIYKYMYVGEKDESFLQYTYELQEAIKNGVDIYKKFLKHHDPSIKLVASELLQALGQL